MHCHILPGADDGAETIEESLQIIRQLCVAGFNMFMATPHVFEGRGYLTPSYILERTDELNYLAHQEGLQVTILPGAENYIFPEMAEWYQKGKLMTLAHGGEYLLIELPMHEIPVYTEQVFFDLMLAGVVPVLAHPERYTALWDEPDIILKWLRQGVLMQLDLRSSIGKYGPRAKKFADLLLKNGLIHFIGSDAHIPTRHPSSYSESLCRLRDLLGEENYQVITETNPWALLRGAAIIEQEYSLNEEHQKSSRWMQTWRKLFLNRSIFYASSNWHDREASM